MMRYVVVACLAATASAAGFLSAPEADISAIKASVAKSEVFQKKVAVLCQHNANKAVCGAKVEDALFCQLLQRSKPDIAAQHCAAPVKRAKKHAAALLQTRSSPIKMDTMRLRIEGTEGFKQETVKMATVMGCNGMKKAQNCDNYVQDVAFCLAFASEIGQFAHMDGVKEETEHCKHIDKKLPELAMFLQKQYSFVQVTEHKHKAPEDELAKEMTHDLEMNFNKIAPFGKEDTAKELQDHAAKTQDTLVDAVENAEVAEIKRAVFRALTRLRAATIKEFDTIARLETQAIDAYNDAHHYRAENPLAHLHEDEAPVETDKLKSFH